MSSRPSAICTLLTCLALLAGCATHHGPIIGHWIGYQRSQGYNFQRTTELILDGSSGDVAGRYRLLTRNNEPFLGDRVDNVRWSDRWQKHQVTFPSGQEYTILHLSDAPGTVLPDYIWLPNNLLVPLSDLNRPDLSPQALSIALHPLPPSTFAYDRL